MNNTDRLITSLHEELIFKEQEINRLNNIINKAIEYIEKWQNFPHTNGTTHEELRNLKNILKGSDK